MGINSEPQSFLQEQANEYAVTPVVNSNTLRIVDNRTGKEYIVPIVRNAVPAMAFRQMKAPANPDAPCDQTEHGIRVYDPGFGNTAVSESNIAYK